MNQHETGEQALSRIRLETIAQTRNLVPLNTKAAYKPGQVEFKAYCIERGFMDQDTVTAEKLLAFMQEKVIGRQSKRQKGNGINATIGMSTTNMYLSSITNLWSQQSAMKMNSHPNPRTDPVMKGKY